MNTLHRVVLLGNPNVGKSALFSRLTGTKVVSGNFPGTTLSVTRGALEVHSRHHDTKVFELIDVPGVYSLTEKTETSQRGARFVIQHADLIVNVIDATNLKRNLYLTMQLKQLGRPMVVALNMSDEAQYHGITIDTKELSRQLGVPVIATTAVTGHGMAALRTALTRTVLATRPEWCGQQSAQSCCTSSCTSPHPTDVTQPDWKKITAIMAAAHHASPRRKRPWEYLATLTLHPFWGTLFAIGVLATTLTSVFYLSNALESSINALFTYTLTTPLCWLHNLLSFSPFLQQTIVGTVTYMDPGQAGMTVGHGVIDFETAMGLLSTGVYIPLGQVAPVVTAFYFAMGLLEDAGYLPRLAILADTLMHRYALHGFALIPMLLGAGCNVTGIVGTRVLDSRQQRIITAALLSITIPCASQTGFIVAMADRMGALYTSLIFVTLGLTWHLLGLLLGAQQKQNYQELLIEIPPLRMPRLQQSLHKLSYRVRNFLSDAIPITIAGIAVLLVLNYFDIFSYLGRTVFSFLHTLWGLPADVIPALFMGLFRKEIALSFLKIIPNLTASQAFISTLLSTLWFPCISVYTILYKEFGGRTLIKLIGLMAAVSTLIGMTAHAVIVAFGAQ